LLSAAAAHKADISKKRVELVGEEAGTFILIDFLFDVV